MEAVSRQRYVAPEYMARSYYALGDVDRAIDWFDRGLQAHSGVALMLDGYRDLAPLRTNPRFVALQTRAGLPR